MHSAHHVQVALNYPWLRDILQFMKFALLKTVAPRQGALDRGQLWAHSSQEGATGGEVGEAERERSTQSSNVSVHKPPL